ncbi:bifunctional diguanylate cyclase/phosphodiesterase [Paludibacterium sp.]|uniref:putative bifunctional diguanylate cyclase/phosphodiesterase n=2 Tax=Paludibacterium sp. TaxID=1917523 RepID=UPI0025CEAA68|nr:GGDEF domain-containing protein [Paludibacterium sp.]
MTAYGHLLFSRRQTLAKQLFWYLLRQHNAVAPDGELAERVEALLQTLERTLSAAHDAGESVLALAVGQQLPLAALSGLAECLTGYLVGEAMALDVPQVVRQALEEALRKRMALDLMLQLQQAGQNDANALAARLYATLSGVSLALINAQSREQLFQAICRICVEEGGFAYAWIGLVDTQQANIRPAALAGDGAEGFIPGVCIDLNGQTPSARAVATGEVQCVDDTLAQQSLMPWRDAMRIGGVRSMLSIPLQLYGQAIGTLVLYARRCHYFDHATVGLVRAMAGEISHALERQDAMARSQKAENDLAYLIQHDPLTGLPNRQLMLERIGQMVQLGQPDSQIGVVTLAIDSFHELNARLGHASGDMVLREVALRMSQRALPHGSVGRVGAARFVAVSDVSEPLDRLVADLQDAMREPIQCQGEHISLRCSIGVVQEHIASADAAALMRCSDLALIRAREAGGGRCRFYDEGMDVEIRRMHALRGDFARALADNELELFYQPKINLVDHKVSGVEALIRWRRADGYMAPGEFFPAIEHTDLMRELDWWVMSEALRHSSVWMAQGKLIPVSVNLSAMTLRHESFLPRIQALIMRHPIPDGHLELEVLETVSQKEAEEIVHKLESCREFGISIALDDFGTGASSLVHLQQLPFDTIKIDQRFVRKLLKAPGNEAIIRSMISFAHYTGRKLVVEGVESQPIWDRLLEIGCTSGQGYAISAPVSASGLMDWLAEREETVALKSA